MADTRATADQLMSDLQSVVEDAEALLKSTRPPVGAAIDEARHRAEASVKAARARLDELQGEVVDRTRHAARTADLYVRDNPWTAIGVAAGVAFVIGLLAGRR